LTSIAEKKTLRQLFNSFIFFGIAYTVIDPLIPVISKNLNIGYDKIGLILFLSSSLSLIATFVAGRLSDRYNLKKIIFTGLLIAGAGFLVYGLYLNIITLLLTIIFFRVGCGILDSATHAYVSKLYIGQHSPIFVNLDFFWYVGAIIGPLIISILLYLKIDTKWAFIVFFIVIAAVSVFFYRNCSNITAESSVADIKNKENTILQKDAYTFNDKNAVKVNNFFHIVKNPIIMLCCAGLFFYSGIFSILSTWLTTYFSDFNIPVSFGSAVLSVFWAFSALGVFITGKILKKRSEISLLFVYTLVGCISAGIYIAIPNIYIKIIFLILQSIFYSSLFPLLNAVAVREDVETSGSILGFTLSAAVIGLIVFQPVSGYVMEYLGKSGINYLIIGSAILEFISMLLLYIYGSRKK
jgi:MFS transporter, ACDE family, multidrug resistance protein